MPRQLFTGPLCVVQQHVVAKGNHGVLCVPGRSCKGWHVEPDGVAEAAERASDNLEKVEHGECRQVVHKVCAAVPEDSYASKAAVAHG